MIPCFPVTSIIASIQETGNIIPAQQKVLVTFEGHISLKKTIYERFYKWYEISVFKLPVIWIKKDDKFS